MSTAELSHTAAPHPIFRPTARAISLIVAVLLLTLCGIQGFIAISGLIRSRQWVTHTYLVRSEIKDTRSLVNEVHSRFQTILLTNDRRGVPALQQLLQDESASLQEIRQLTSDNPPQLLRLDRLVPLAQEDASQINQAVLSPVSIPLSASSIVGRAPEMVALLSDMENDEYELLQNRLNDWGLSLKRMLIALGLSFALFILLFLYNLRLFFEDNARRRQIELAQKESAESYRALSARILELQDFERRKIARELHDSVGQFLAGLKMNLSRLEKQCSSLSVGEPSLLAETIDLTERAIVEVRTISHLLHPPLLDELGFYSAAQWYIDGFSKRSGMETKLRLAEALNRLPKDIEIALFRVLQESLINVHRHAKARTVQVDIDCKDNLVTLIIRDDGAGIPRSVLSRFEEGMAGGIGLAGMRERLSELNGTLVVESNSSTGTVIHATLPTNQCQSGESESEQFVLTSR